MIDHPYGWWSVLPPVVAILLAILTRRVVLSLAFGVFAGSMVLSGGDPIAALANTCQSQIWESVTSQSLLHVFGFTILMGSMVGLINRAAGMRGLVELVSPFAKNRCRGQLTTWILGLLIFFDDYANTILLGNTLRPLSDRLRISREKLAYLVDSTAAPVAGLALISTWVAGEISYVAEGLNKLPVEGAEWTPLSVFVDSIPYRFYVLWALIFVPMVALTGRDFGPMRLAEEEAMRGDRRKQELSGGPTDDTAPDHETPARWYNAVIPIFVTVVSVVWFLVLTGMESVELDADDSLFGSLQQIFGAADSYGSLLWGGLCGMAAAFLLILPQRLITLQDAIRAAGGGARLMVPALLILALASSLSALTGNEPIASKSGSIELFDSLGATLSEEGVGSVRIAAILHDHGASAQDAASALLQSGIDPESVDAALAGAHFDKEAVERVKARVATDVGGESFIAFPYRQYRLYTGAFLSNLVGDRIPSPWLPTIVFLLSAGVAFSTGTSWGTMGIIMPLILPLVYGILVAEGDAVAPNDPIFLGSVGAVLAGAIFGDHCSPISDTTVLSSQASGCDHVEHVRTQLPYAMLVATISVLFGTLPIGFGVPVWLLLPLGVLVMLACLFVFGKRVDLEKDDQVD